MAKVSICVAYYNRSEFVSSCIGSLLNQAYDDFEVIVVNDGSPDGQTQIELERFNDQRLKVVYQENSGFVGAMRKAISLATGDYIAIQGAGDVSLPRRIATQAKYLDEHPDIGIVSCRYENVVIGGDNDGSKNTYHYPHTDITIDDVLTGSNPFGHGEVMYRKSLYEKVGGYRDFFRFAQDRDLWLRILPLCKGRIIDEILYQRCLFTSDGIATNIEKLVLQRFLSVFARQCYYDRLEFGFDYVDKYGPQAGLYRKNSKLIRDFCSKKSLQTFYSGKEEQANRLILLSLSQGKSITNLLIYSLIKSTKNPFCKKLLLKIISLHPRSQNWYQS
ncbi:glycosyltransferase family 2 protein [Alteromonas stellipolaris]|uniref:glycosyltransferase family 2 protein n=1 Tax=Alteromonas stellipolaris TaxID=233316 RepID=UPI0024945BC9|nr:glycosyltransferase [Alteromonas stellipolaris]